MFSEPQPITLSRSYCFAGGHRQHITMREPTTLDISRTLTSTAQHKDDSELREFEKEKYLMAFLCDLAPDDLNQLVHHDYELLQLNLVAMRAKPEDRDGVRTSLGLDKQQGEEQAADS